MVRRLTLRLFIIIVAVLLAAMGFGRKKGALMPGGDRGNQTQTEARQSDTQSNRSENSPKIDQGGPVIIGQRVEGVKVRSHGKVVYEGTVDLAPTLRRIEEGKSFPHRNDGAVFGNFEGLLPAKPRGYYREYVVPTKGLDGPGPQRLVMGKEGEIYYTPDHYATFLPVPSES